MTHIVTLMPSGYKPYLDQQPRRIKWFEVWRNYPHSFIPVHDRETRAMVEFILSSLNKSKLYVSRICLVVKIDSLDDSLKNIEVIYFRVFDYNGIFRPVNEFPRISKDSQFDLQSKLERKTTYRNGWLGVEMLS